MKGSNVVEKIEKVPVSPRKGGSREVERGREGGREGGEVRTSQIARKDACLPRPFAAFLRCAFKWALFRK